MTTTVRHPRRLGYQGPGIPLWSQAGKPSKRRERWMALLRRDQSLTATAIRVVEHLATYGNPDGSSTYPSEARLAADLGLSTGTVSRAVCEAEDAGWLRVLRWRPIRDPATGCWKRRHTNTYTLCLKPEGASLLGRRRHRRRSGPHPLEHRRAREEEEAARKREEIAKRLAAVEAELEAARSLTARPLPPPLPERPDTAEEPGGEPTPPPVPDEVRERFAALRAALDASGTHPPPTPTPPR